MPGAAPVLIMPKRFCSATDCDWLFIAPAFSTSLFFLLLRAAMRTVGSSLKPWMKCRPRPMVKMAMRLPGLAVLRYCRAALWTALWLSVVVLRESSSRTLTAGGLGNGEKLVKTSVGILGICTDCGGGTGAFSSKKETACGLPDSVTVKASFLRPVTGLPLLVTMTSRTTLREVTRSVGGCAWAYKAVRLRKQPNNLCGIRFGNRLLSHPCNRRNRKADAGNVLVDTAVILRPVGAVRRSLMEFPWCQLCVSCGPGCR